MDALTRSLFMVAGSSPIVLRSGTASGSGYTADLQFSPDGTVGLTGGTFYAWLLNGAASDYQVSYSLISGSALSLAADAWFGLGSVRNFRRTAYAAGSTVAEFTIRRASDNAIMARAIITFTTASTAPPIDATISPASHTTEFDSSTVNSSSGITCTATGGLGGPYTYAWAKTSGDAIAIVSGASSATAVFQATGMAPGESRTANFRCTVSDASDSDLSNLVAITLKRPA